MSSLLWFRESQTSKLSSRYQAGGGKGAEGCGRAVRERFMIMDLIQEHLCPITLQLGHSTLKSCLYINPDEKNEGFPVCLSNQLQAIQGSY